MNKKYKLAQYGIKPVKNRLRTKKDRKTNQVCIAQWVKVNTRRLLLKFTSMPANHKVSVAWQIVALFIPIANFWAFYRIRRLQKYLLYVIIPDIAVGIVSVYQYISTLKRGVIWGDSALAFGDPYAGLSSDPVIITTNLASWALFGLSIYLVVKWSREHNRKFDQPTAQVT